MSSRLACLRFVGGGVPKAVACFLPPLAFGAAVFKIEWAWELEEELALDVELALLLPVLLLPESRKSASPSHL